MAASLNETQVCQGESTSQHSSGRSAVLSGIQNSIQLSYTSYMLPKMSFLKEIVDMPIVDYFTEPTLYVQSFGSQPGRFIRPCNIFKSTMQKPCKRVWIDGEAGSGKTTLAAKLVYDWATGEKYMQRFRLVFHVPIQKMKNRKNWTLVDDIHSLVVGNEKIAMNQLNRAIYKFANKTLFILDGLERVSLKRRKEITKILHKRKFGSMFLIVLSRPGTCRSMLGNQDGVFDKRITLRGFEEARVKCKFLKMYFPTFDFYDEVLKLESRLRPVDFQNFDYPYLLLLLGNALKQRGVAIGMTLTEVYRSIFNDVVNCSLHHDDDEIDLFCPGQTEATTKKMRESFRCFGIMSLRRILKNYDDSQFLDCNYSTEILRVFEILMILEDRNNVDSNICFEGCYKSILEFASAYGVWVDFKLNNLNFNRGRLTEIVKHFFFETEGRSGILPFLFGLLQEESCHLFSQTRSLAYIYTSQFERLSHALRDCPSSVPIDLNLVKMISPLLTDSSFDPQQGGWSDFETYRLCEKMFAGDGGVFSRVLIESNDKNRCFKIVFDFKSDAWVSFLLDDQCRLHILNVTLSLQAGEIQERIDDYSSLLQSAQKESCSVSLHGLCITRVLLSFETSTFDKVRFCYLQFGIAGKIDKEAIVGMLKRNQIRFLHLVVGCSINVEEVLRAIAGSSGLTSLHLVMYRVSDEVDLSVLTDGGQKTFEYLELENCTIVCHRSHDVAVASCKCLSMNECFTPEAVGCFAGPLWLSVSGGLFDPYENRFFLSNVKHLTLDLVEEGDSAQFFRVGLLERSRLKTLHVRFEDTISNEKNLKKMEFIHQFDIDRLTIEYEYAACKLTEEQLRKNKNYGLDEELTSFLARLRGDGKLKVIEFVIWSPSPLCCSDDHPGAIIMTKNVIKLMTALIENCYDELVLFVTPALSKTFLSLVATFGSFDIRHRPYGNNPNCRESLRRDVRHSLLLDAFSITRPKC